MSWISRIFRTRNAESTLAVDTGPVVKVLPEITGRIIEEAMGEITTMLGVSMAFAFDKNGRLLYEYRRWIEEGTFDSKSIMTVTNVILEFMTKNTKESLSNAILRSENANILIQIADNVVLFVHTLENINLALISIRIRRAAIAISEAQGGKR